MRETTVGSGASRRPRERAGSLGSGQFRTAAPSWVMDPREVSEPPKTLSSSLGKLKLREK